MSKPAPPRSRVRRWAARLVAVAVGIALALVLAEIALRIINPHRPRPRAYVGQHQNKESRNFVADADVGWRMRPNHRFTAPDDGKDVLYVSDAGGFRIDPARPAPRDPRKLVAIGDSFTFGKGVEAGQAFPSLLAERLAGWQLVNVAQPGYGLDQVWQALVHEAIPLKPDLIVAGIFPEDFERSLSAFRLREGLNKPTFRLDGGRLVPLTADDRPNPLMVLAENHSRVLAAWRQFCIGMCYRWGIGEMWTLNAAILDEMMSAAADARIPIVFVFLPFRTLDPFPPLAGHMLKRGAHFVDPLDAMKALPQDTLYIKDDQHLNAAGHEVVATAIERFLQRRPDLLRGSATRPEPARPR